jgi:spore germination protein YaaH
MFGFSLLGTVLIGASFLAALGVVKPPGSHPAGPTRAALSSGSVNAAAQVGNRFAVGGTKAVNLPAATSAPVAAPAALVSAPPIAARENFGFAPYWTLPQSATFSLTGLSTLAYFSVGVNPNGTLEESGPGWNGYESQALADLITRAHGAGERVVLTVNDFGQSSLDALTSSPTAAATLAAALTPVLQAKSLDGVNFDFEGEGSGDQAGLTNLITSVSGALRAADPHWQITMDTYASSAGDPGGFYNIPALAPAVDAFFVMAYELNLQGAATAASPLTSGMFSDLTAVQQYAAVVPAAKVILGTPFFGIDWPTANGTLQATPTGAAADIADAQVPSTAPLYWDPVTGTGWTSYQVGPQWHESFFETPYGLYLVAQLAAHYGLRGVGIWALGMESNGPQMIAALDGLAPAGSPGGTGPTATSTSPTTPVATASGPAASPTTTGPGSTTTSAPGAPAAPGATSTTKPAGATTTTTTAGPVITGAFHGTLHTLKPVGPGSVDKGLALGSMISFSTTDPAYSCLNGKALPVYPYGTLSGYDVAVAAAPGDCITQEFIFPG